MKGELYQLIHFTEESIHYYILVDTEFLKQEIT